MISFRPWLAILGLLVVTLSACGSPDTTHSEADVTYLQAVAKDQANTAKISQVMASTAANAQARDLGSAISRSQLRYSQRATELLSRWDVSVPDPGVDPEGQALNARVSATFDADVLTLLQQRHEGVIALSNTEVEGGQNDETQQLARDLVSARTAELGQIKALLALVPAPSASTGGTTGQSS